MLWLQPNEQSLWEVDWKRLMWESRAPTYVARCCDRFRRWNMLSSSSSNVTWLQCNHIMFIATKTMPKIIFSQTYPFPWVTICTCLLHSLHCNFECILTVYISLLDFQKPHDLVGRILLCGFVITKDFLSLNQITRATTIHETSEDDPCALIKNNEKLERYYQEIGWPNWI